MYDYCWLLKESHWCSTRSVGGSVVECDSCALVETCAIVGSVRSADASLVKVDAVGTVCFQLSVVMAGGV